jgi:signal transduction histidine kinase
MPPFDRIAAEEAFLKVRTVLIALVLVTLVVHWARASRPLRRAMAPVALTAAALALNFVAGDLYVNAHYVFSPADQLTYIDIPTAILTALIPGAFLGTLLSTEVTRSPVGRLMAELGRTPSEELEDPLRRALADPSLEVGYWADPPGTYVDTKGAPLSLPASGGSRAASYVTDAGMPLAVLVHDAALLEDGALIDAVSSAARLTLRNARLRAELRAQLRLVSTSRARILAASDEERRRIQADLATGVEPRLERLAELIGSLRAAAPAASAAEALVDEIDQASRDTRAELRDLAAGVHPAALSEEGLASALRMLAERAAIPVALGSLPDRRLPVPVVVAAYFVCSEAITNATKHSGASEVVIEAAVVGASLELTVTDDGAGGARLDRGSGLSGLVDRVDALGGRLELESPSGGGTRLAAVLPLSP